MKATIKRLGNGANGALRLEVVLPDSSCAMDTRGRIRVALRAIPEMPAAGAKYRLGKIINRDYGNGYTRYTVEIVPKTALETRRTARGYIPLANIGNGLQGRFWRVLCDMPIFTHFPMAAWLGDSENKTK